MYGELFSVTQLPTQTLDEPQKMSDKPADIRIFDLVKA